MKRGAKCKRLPLPLRKFFYMKQTLLSLLVFLCCAFATQAQEATLEGVSARGFSGVKTINGEFYYTFYFGEKT